MKKLPPYKGPLTAAIFTAAILAVSVLFYSVAGVDLIGGAAAVSSAYSPGGGSRLTCGCPFNIVSGASLSRAYVYYAANPKREDGYRPLRDAVIAALGAKTSSRGITQANRVLVVMDQSEARRPVDVKSVIGSVVGGACIEVATPPNVPKDAFVTDPPNMTAVKTYTAFLKSVDQKISTCKALAK